jgi:nucleotide-binding universal stress UspA family protein
MTTFESHRARTEARGAVSTDRVPSADHETALQKYLTTSAYLSTSAVVHHPGRVPAGGPADDARRSTGGPVIVGIDGSACARAAAEWAAAEAERRGTALRLLHAYVLPPAGYSAYNPYPPNILGEMREEGRCLLRDTVTEIRRHHPGVSVTTKMVYGDPKRVLARESAGAVVTVVGAHGRNRVAMALGSVAAKLAHSNPAPVAVIHPGRQPGSGPVLLGIDGTTGDEALDFAFGAANLRGCGLTALHCWTEEMVDGLVQEQYTATFGGLPTADSEADWLTERLAGWLSRYPHVAVERLITDRPATTALLDRAATAQLVVIGHRGHGGLAGLILGSTGQAMITRCAAPVVIVPPAKNH